MNSPINIPSFVEDAVNRINAVLTINDLNALEKELVGKDSTLSHEQAKVQLLIETSRPQRINQIKMNMQLLAEHIAQRRRLIVESTVTGQPLRPIRQKKSI